MTDRADEVAWAAMHAADDCDHSGHEASTNPEVNADRECLAMHIAVALRDYAEEARREGLEAWIAALCQNCSRGHLLDNGRVWALCGARKAMPGIPEEVIAAAILARGEKG